MSVAYSASTAYDYRKYDERTEYEAPAVAARPVRRSAVMFRRALVFVAAIFAAAVCIGFLYMKAAVFKSQREVNDIKNEIVTAQKLNSNLSEQLNEATNINVIMDKAAALGMGSPTGDQVLYVDLNTGTASVEMKK